jgi:nucleoside-diphosphate-sugar epimerase
MWQQHACQPPPRFVFFSTVAVYGEATPPVGLPEDAPPAPATAYARSKVEAEQAVQAWGRRTGGVATVLRLATVYGPRDRGNMVRMLDALARGRFVLAGGGRNRKTVVGVDNAALAALSVARAEASRVAGRAFVVADAAEAPRVRDLAVVMRRALQTAGDPLPGAPQALPVGVLLPVAYAAQTAARVLGRRSPLTVAQVRRLAAWNVYSARALREIVGYLPPFGLSEGMARAAAWYVESRRSARHG